MLVPTLPGGEYLTQDSGSVSHEFLQELINICVILAKINMACGILSLVIILLSVNKLNVLSLSEKVLGGKVDGENC